MVRVLLFHYFKAQRVFFDSFQPTSITSTNDYLFLATGEMKVLVYSLELPNFPLLCQFPTISKPVKLVCNEKAKCVVTIERKTERRKSGRGALTRSRAYFNWFKAHLDEAVRTYVAGHSLHQSQEAENTGKAFLVVEIPTQSNVSDICCCPTSGNIAIASEKKVSLFRWNSNLSSDGSNACAASCDMEHFLDIEPSMTIKEMALSDSYLALRSNLDVQVLKLVFTSEQESMSATGSGKLLGYGATLQNRATKSGWGLESLQQQTDQMQDHGQANDEDCVLWSFDDCSPLFVSTQPLAARSPDQDVMLPAIRKEKMFKDFLPDPKEVLGPVSEVPGHPVSVAFGGLYGIGIAVDGRMLKVKGVTMLYRRFRVEQLSNDGNDSATLHTLQLLPVYTQGIPQIKEMQRSPLVPKKTSDPTLCGMCCLISGPKEGFMYDVFSSCKLLSYYKYTCDTISVSACNGLLHAITKQGIETYTVRVYATTSDWIRANAAVDVKLDQGLVEVHSSHNSIEQEEMPVTRESEESRQDLESKNNVELAVGCHDKTEVSNSKPVVAAAQSAESANMISVKSDVDQELQSADTVSITEDLPSSTCNTSLSNIEALEVETPVKIAKPVGSERSDDSSPNSKEEDSSPSDVKLTVDNSGKTLVRFTYRSRTPSPAVARKEAQVEDSHNSESHPEFTASQRTKAFAVVNPLSRSGSSGTKLSDAAYQAAVNKLASDCGWTLPIFELESLRQRCPQSSLDICLIGMYPFVGSRYVSATNGSVVLFTRASHDALQRSKSFKGRQPKLQQEQGDSGKSDWTVHILQNMEPTQLYKAVMPLANRCQKHNAQAYHHLVCEQHLFLRTLCLADATGKEDKKRKKVRKMLCESAANLAELFARIPSVHQDCADYFNMSGLTLRDIVDRACKSGQTVAEGLIYFLDEKLLGSDEPVTVSENTAKKIFKLYSKGKPGRVAEIILMSSLSGFSSDTALSALEDLKKVKTTESGIYSLSPLDNLVRAVLYLHQCEPDHAHAALYSIPKKKLVEVLTTHYYLLHEDGTYFTPLAQLLRKYQQAVFMEVLLQLHDRYVLSLDTLLTLLGTSKPDAVYNEMAIGFMEAVLNDKNRVDSFAATVIPLCQIYLERIGSTPRKRQSSSSHQHVPKGEGHFGVRHLWLNKLSPFQGSLALSVPGCPCSKPVSPQGSPQVSRSSLFSSAARRVAAKSPYFAPIYTGDTSVSVQECCCCCCNEDLIKLQALLCSPFVSSELCDFVLSKIEGQKMRDVTSLSLLCYPHVNRHTEAVAVILEEFPEILLPYAEYYFNQDIDKWSHLVKTLLDMCKEESSSDDSESKKVVMIAVLKGTLQQLSTIVTPSEFLALLPSDGCVGFFLPYLQQCYSRCASDSVSKRLVTRTRQLAT